MDTQLGKEPAFPNDEQKINYCERGIINSAHNGMSKRFYAACVAMQGLLSNPNIKRPHPQDGSMEDQLKAFATVAYEYADELLKQENES